MSYALFFILFLFLSQVMVKAQPEVVDSLKAELSNLSGSDRITVLLELTRTLRYISSAEAIEYANETIELLKSQPDIKYEIEALYQAGWAYIYQKKFETALNYAGRIERSARTLDDDEALAKSCILKGRVYREKGEYEVSLINFTNALKHTEGHHTRTRIIALNETGGVYRRQGNYTLTIKLHSEAAELARELDDKLSLSTSLDRLGIINTLMGNYDDALLNHQETLEIKKELNDRRGVATSLNSIGVIYHYIQNYDEALRFYKQAHEIYRELDSKLDYATTYHNIGNIYETQGNLEEALIHYQSVLKIWEEFNDSESIALALSNIGAVKKQQGKYKEALNFKLKSLEISQSLGGQSENATTLIDIAELQKILKKPELALKAAHESLLLAEQTGSWTIIRDAHKILSELYESLGQTQVSLVHFKEYKVANDSLFNIESQKVIGELQTKYKTNEQQQQIASLQQQEKIQNLWFTILGGGTFLIVVVMSLIYSRYRLKNKAHKTLEDLHIKEMDRAKLEAEKAAATAKYLHAENERKSQELNAARDLQLSMLPSKLPEIPNYSFATHMKTASEVGGDYYDFYVHKDNTATIAIGDAAGHGLEAGTMVTATKSLFNLLAGKDELPRILQLCSKAIQRMNLPKLFMALALIRLRDNTLQFAGAGMPPALVYRAETGKVEKVELKGLPLGGFIDYPYKETTVDLKKDDVVFLYTDGFPELFNPEDEILGYEIAPQLLAEVGHKPLDEIIDHFRVVGNKWMEGVELKDDVTFVVLKSTA